MVATPEAPEEIDDILDGIMGDIDEGTRKEELVKAKRNVEAKLMESLANLRLQKDVVEQKEAAFDALPDDTSEQELRQREAALDSGKLVLEDCAQGCRALARELKRINKALEDMKTAGLAPFGNRETRRRSRK
jgi:hypothetical protein